MDAHQVGGIMAKALEVLNAVIAAHIPSDVVGMSHHNLGDSRCPTAAADDGNGPTPGPPCKGGIGIFL